MLRGGDDVGGGGVHDQYATAGGRLHVNVVDAHAGPADDAELLAGLDDLGGDLGAAADDERRRTRR